jgi:hypothetical protein
VTEPLAPHGLTAQCLNCGIEFTPRKAGHVFCSAFCRHRGERRPDQRVPADPDLVAKLFDEGRDPEALVRVDDWHPGGPEWAALDACVDTVRGRRAWYWEMQRQGRL